MSHLKDILEDPALEYEYKYICQNCIKDIGLKKYIKNHKTTKPVSCYICNKTRYATSLYDFLTFIKTRIHTEYDDAETALPWDDEKKEPMGETQDTEELITNLFDYTEKEKFLNILKEILGEKRWCSLDYYWKHIYNPIGYSWEALKKEVLHNRRFTLFLSAPDDPSIIEKTTYINIIDKIQYLIEKYKLIKTIKQNTIFFRGRVKNKNAKDYLQAGDPNYLYKPFDNVTDLCSPSHENARENRMNPKGISMFYCAEAESVVLSELDNTTNTSTTIAQFKNIKELQILDLGKIPEIPSLFDEDFETTERKLIIFLNDFASDITKKTTDDDTKLEYIPTQIVTEYFKFYLKTDYKKPIDGIRYKSSKNTKFNYVFFCDKYNFKDAWLYNYDDIWFELLPKTIKLYKTKK